MRRSLFRGLPPEWNQIVRSEDHFYDFIDAHAIVFRDHRRVKDKGCYTWSEGFPCILLDCRLRGAERTWGLWHEVGHYFLHEPTDHYLLGRDKLSDKEADIFAACALIPQLVLANFSDQEIMESHGYAPWMLRYRRMVWRDYRI